MIVGHNLTLGPFQSIQLPMAFALARINAHCRTRLGLVGHSLSRSAWAGLFIAGKDLDLGYVLGHKPSAYTQKAGHHGMPFFSSLQNRIRICMLTTVTARCSRPFMISQPGPTNSTNQ